MYEEIGLVFFCTSVEHWSRQSCAKPTLQNAMSADDLTGTILNLAFRRLTPFSRLIRWAHARARTSHPAASPCSAGPRSRSTSDAEDAERWFVCLYGNALDSQGKARSNCMKCCNDGTAMCRAPGLICTIMLPKTTAKTGLLQRGFELTEEATLQRASSRTKHATNVPRAAIMV